MIVNSRTQLTRSFGSADGRMERMPFKKTQKTNRQRDDKQRDAQIRLSQNREDSDKIPIKE